MTGSCHVPADAASSRTAASAAWDDSQQAPYNAQWEEMLGRRVRPRWTNFSWISPATLLDSLNDQVVKGVDDVIEAQRMRWIATLRQARRAGGAPDPAVEWWFSPVEEATRFVVMGDPGEQDASQYAVVRPLVARAQAAQAQFMVVMSDVIYPAGDVNDYIDGFYRAYEAFPAPIYALPGNHDWYDGLEGFMYHFCGAEPLPPTAHRGSSYRFAERVAQRLWRRSSRPAREDLYRYGQRRTTPPGGPAHLQPGPYYALETEHVVLVCIDTGVTGELDAEQGDWLCQVADKGTKPKVLLTGKPLYVDGAYHPGQIRWGDPESKPFRTVDDIVRAPQHRFVAAIGGDIHNYQHYRVTVRDPQGASVGNSDAPERTIEYLVSGGGGAFLSATHRIGRVEINQDVDPHFPGDVVAVTEDDFCCYPLRGDSLALFTRGFGRTVGWLCLLAWVLVGGLIAALPLHAYSLHFANAQIPAAGWVALAAIVLVAATVGLVVLAGAAVRRLGRPLHGAVGVPVAGFVGIGLVVAGGAALVLVADVTLSDPWSWVPRVALVTSVVVLVPLVIVLGSYYARGQGPAVLGHVVLVGAIIAIPVVRAKPNTVSELALTATLAAPAIVTGALASAALHKRAKRWYPRILTLGLTLIAVAVLIGFARDEWYAQVGAAVVAGLLSALLLGVALIAWRALLWPFIFISARMDPDKAIVEYARRTDTSAERPTTASSDRSTRWLAGLLLGCPSRVANAMVSEIAEASAPPFFKSFLTARTDERSLTIECWGVSGYAAQETSPTLEDRVVIPLD